MPLAQRNALCHALGDGTANGALALFRQTNIEITDTDRYSRWGEATWGLEFKTRHNASKRVIDEVDSDVIARMCDQDLELYGVIRERLRNNLSIFGRQI
jgi:hypothetical protein